MRNGYRSAIERRNERADRSKVQHILAKVDGCPSCLGSKAVGSVVCKGPCNFHFSLIYTMQPATANKRTRILAHDWPDGKALILLLVDRTIDPCIGACQRIIEDRSKRLRIGVHPCAQNQPFGFKKGHDLNCA